MSGTDQHSDLSHLAKFGITEQGLKCAACGFAEIPVPPGYRNQLAMLVRIAENHNREEHSS